MFYDTLNEKVWEEALIETKIIYFILNGIKVLDLKYM